MGPLEMMANRLWDRRCERSYDDLQRISGLARTIYPLAAAACAK